MTDARHARFEREVMPHLAAAYSLARWLLRHPQDAEDAVQDALVRAYRAYGGRQVADPAPWLLAIVRNTCLTALKRRRAVASNVVKLRDTTWESGTDGIDVPDPLPIADAALEAAEDRKRVHAAIAALPEQFREVIVLRELQELSYAQIAAVIGAPVGTVMSRLARAREKLAAELVADNVAVSRGKDGKP